MKLTFLVSQAARPPWWAGLVYRDYIRDAGVFTLMPFHHLFRLFRNIYFWYKYPKALSKRELIEREVQLALAIQRAEHIEAIRKLGDSGEVYSCGDYVPDQVIELLKEISKELHDITIPN